MRGEPNSVAAGCWGMALPTPGSWRCSATLCRLEMHSARHRQADKPQVAFPARRTARIKPYLADKTRLEKYRGLAEVARPVDAELRLDNGTEIVAGTSG